MTSKRRSGQNIAAVDRPRVREAFLAHFRENANVSLACFEAGISRESVYEWRRTDPDFAEQWSEAEQEATETLEGEVYRRAVYGVTKPVTVAGRREVVQEYSDTLAIFLLKARRPHVYRDNAGVSVHVQQAQYQQVNVDPDALHEAESAYLAALAGKSSIETGDSPKPPAISLSGNGVAGPEPATPDP